MESAQAGIYNFNIPPKEKEDLIVIKIGGKIIDDEQRLKSFLRDFALLKLPGQHTFTKKILVHGGGKLASKLAGQLSVPQQMIEGRRITDAETLKIVTMVYAGYINKNIVAQLQAYNCNAVGLTGADGNLIQAHKRIHSTIDYGFVGDVEVINIQLLQNLLEQNITIVLAPITHDKRGQLLNTNADTIVQEIANELSDFYEVLLIYSFEKDGVLESEQNENTVIKKLDLETYTHLKRSGVIFGGMIPKLDNAFKALNNGVGKVIIGKAENINQLIDGEAGTIITR